MTSPWVRRLRAAVDRFFRRPPVDAAVMVLVLVSVVLLLVEFYLPEDRPFHPVAVGVGDMITGLFVVELSLRWFAAGSSRRHLREYWLDWLAVIPFFRPVRILRGLRLLRALRLLRLFRFGLLAHRFAGTFDPRHFEDQLREALAHYDGPQADYVTVAPDLYRALANLLEDGRVGRDARGQICRAIAYFVLPYDVRPAQQGEESYVDDVYLAMSVLDRLREELPEDALESAWEGEGTLVSLLDEALPSLSRELGDEETEHVMRYVGLPPLRVASLAGAPR